MAGKKGTKKAAAKKAPEVVIGVDKADVKVEVKDKEKTTSTIFPQDVEMWFPATPINHSGIHVANIAHPFSIDGQLYSHELYYLVMAEQGRFYFAIPKNIVNYFLKIFPK